MLTAAISALADDVYACISVPVLRRGSRDFVLADAINLRQASQRHGVHPGRDMARTRDG